MLDTTWRRLTATAAVLTAATVAFIGAAAMPAAAQTAGFSDVPQDAYYAKPVADLHAQGVFDGTLCEAGFCPRQAIDRKTMAVWTVRVLDGQDPPPITRSRFDDVDPAVFHARFIERMAELGVTSGCGDGTGFCPDRTVTRAQMAVFLSRAFNLAEGSDPGFVDVPADAWYAADVARLAASGITVGCAAGRFCPDQDTTRAQVAVFLWRAQEAVGPDTDFGRDVSLDPTPGATPSLEGTFDVRPLTLTVYYCGTNRSFDIGAAIEQFEGTIDPFYRRQSGYTSDDDRGTRIIFSEGGHLTPSGVTWNSPNTTISAWSAKEDKVWESEGSIYGVDPCSEEARKDAGNFQVLVLVDIPTRSVNGFAWVDRGPVVVATSSQRGLAFSDHRYLTTVAHEIGHAFYAWRHPWHESELDFDPYGSINQQQYAYELASLMSWNKFIGRNYNLSENGSDRAYISCRQRAKKHWVTWDRRSEECVTPIPPDKPAVPDVRRGDSSLEVSWLPPADNGTRIDDYDVRYFAAGGDQWTTWRPDETSTSTTATIRGLRNGTIYYVSVRATNARGSSDWSNDAIGIPQTTGSRTPEVLLRVGESAQGVQGADGECTSVHCRWLHVDIRNFAQEPRTLVCAHNGVDSAGFGPGAYTDQVSVSDWPATDSCLFGYPGSEVFVIVDPEFRDGRWHGGVRSNVIEWPFIRGENEVRISWGTDASGRSLCPAGESCRNLSYEYIGDWPSQPYTLECWVDGRRGWVGQWSGRPHTGCLYWDNGTRAQVVINGVRSNEITLDGSVEPTELQVRISWGTDASGRSLCPAGESCRNLSYEYIGDWPSQPYTLECWVDGRRGWVGQWSGRPHTGCLYWDNGTRAQVVINGVRSNEITLDGSVEPTELQVRISWGTDASGRSLCPAGESCRNLSYEYIGDWPSQPYTLECWVDGRRGWVGQWSGRPHTGCLYWDNGTRAQVVINGVRSNEITFPGS